MAGANAQCDWVSVGPADTNQIEFGGGTGSTYNALAINPANNNPYVVFRDADAPNYYGSSVREYVGGEWKYVGAAGFTAGEGKFNAITFDKHGNPYVATQDAGYTLHCAVYYLNGGVWDTLTGQKAGFTHPAQYLSIATDTNGAPYVAFEDLSTVKLDVLRYDDTTNVWKPVGGSLGISPGQAQYEAIAFDKVHNTPYVAFEDGSNQDKLMVYSFNSSTNTWSAVGGSTYTTGISADTVNWVSLAIDKNGTPFVAYEDFSNGQNLGMMTYNGTVWVVDTAGVGANLGGPVNYNSIGVDSVDNVYVSYQDLSYYGGEKLSIAEYTNATSKWNFVSSYKVSQAISQGDGVYTSLAMANGGIPVVTYNDKGIGDHCEAFSYNFTNKNWVYLGSEGLSNGSGSKWNGKANYLSTAISPTSNEPYVSYQDGNNSLKTTVMSWSGSAWNVVGTPGISVGEAKFTTIGFDQAGDPIACFSDDGASTKYGVSVMKYSGGTWSPIGTNAATISGKDAYNVSMAISSSDTVYVTYQDYGYGIDVMKCAVNGTTWEMVGPADFSGDTASEMSIAVDKNGMPYVAFIDDKDTEGVTVMNYKSGTWNVVGARGFSGGGCNYTAIQINPINNLPAVSYDNWNASNEADVEQYNGTAWAFVGGSGISHDWASYTALYIDKKGNYYTAYQDFGNEVSTEGYGNSTVEFFGANASAWTYLPTTPSDGSASFGGATNETIAVDNTGVIYAGFVGYSAYVKKMDCPALGIDELNTTDNVQTAKVYPNPSHGSFTVELQNASGQYLNVFNMLGEDIYQSRLTSDQTQVNLVNQAPGIYLYRILDENGQVVSTGKLVIEQK